MRKKYKIIEFSTSIFSKEQYISYSEILRLDQVKKLICKDGGKHEISDNDLELLRPDIVALNEVRRRVILECIAAKLVQARRDAGLDSFPEDVYSSKENINEALILHPTSLCQSSPDNQMNYSDVLSMLFSADSSIQHFKPRLSVEKYRPASTTHIHIVNALHASAASNFGTIADLDAASALFVCLRCHPLNRHLLPWRKLVR